MSARDKFHNAVRNALIKDGWTITHDPLTYQIGEMKFQIDLGAQQLIGASKDNQRIAVEVKSFVGHSTVTDAYNAVGQIIFYEQAIESQDPNRGLFLAVPHDTYKTFFKIDFVQGVLQKYQINLIVYNPTFEEIVLWTR